MLIKTQHDQVTRFDSARSLAGRGFYWTSAYLVDGLLVDSGCANSAEELANQLAGEYLTSLVNTHSHEDHIGANGILQQRHQELRILAHGHALPVLEDPHNRQPLHLYRRVMWGWPQACHGIAVGDDEFIDTEHHRFQVLFTAGHSPDHICLYEPREGWLFSGDLFVGGRERALIANANIWETIASLKRVKDLGAGVLFPGCARVRENPQKELAGKIEYLEEMGERVLEAHAKGLGITAITRRLLGNPMWIEIVTGGHFSRRNLVHSYLAQDGNLHETR